MWSEQLQALTRKALYEVQMEAFIRNNCCHLKCLDGKFGTISLENAVKAMSNNQYIVDLEDDGGTISFNSLDELIVAGWAMD